jgi:hypothetical protein
MQTIIEKLESLPLEYPRASRDILALKDTIR